VIDAYVLLIVLLIVSEADALYTSARARDAALHPVAYLANKRRKVVITPVYNTYPRRSPASIGFSP